MAKSKKKQKKRPQRIAIVIALVALMIIGCFAAYRTLRKKAVDMVAEKLLETQLNSEATGVDPEEILDSMQQEDRDAVEEIVSDKISPETIADASSYLSSGDTEGLRDYAQSILTEEELAKLEEICAKYQDEINEYLNQ